MNTNALAKLYDRLTPLERLPLIMAAVERGDDAEANRLSRSAPRIHVSLPDYHGFGYGLLLLSLFHMVEQLQFGLLFWQLSGLASDWEAFPAGKEDKARADRLWNLARVMAYRLCVEADGFRRLCAELKIDRDAWLRDIPAYDALQLTEQAARGVACTPEEATTADLRRCGDEAAEAPTAETAAKAMREFIDHRIAWWG
jgi:hypothetical protein